MRVNQELRTWVYKFETFLVVGYSVRLSLVDDRNPVTKKKRPTTEVNPISIQKGSGPVNKVVQSTKTHSPFDPHHTTQETRTQEVAYRRHVIRVISLRYNPIITAVFVLVSLLLGVRLSDTKGFVSGWGRYYLS